MKRLGLWGLAIIVNGLLAVPVLLLFSEPAPSQNNNGHTIEFISLSLPATSSPEQSPSKKTTPSPVMSEPKAESPQNASLSESVPEPVSKPVPKPVPIAKPPPIKKSALASARLQKETVQKTETTDNSSSHQQDKTALKPSYNQAPNSSSSALIDDDDARKNQPAKIITKSEPDYPSRARKRGIEGYVTVEFLVEKNGQVGHIKVLQEKPAGIFNQVAIEAVKQWHFQPASKSGQAISETVTQTIYFQLN